ncbi:MAG: hypothetical protein L0H93_07865 [Nocardioides sp.]|nr:hypothetical protein [Nocardioides sp.]
MTATGEPAAQEDLTFQERARRSWERTADNWDAESLDFKRIPASGRDDTRPPPWLGWPAMTAPASLWAITATAHSALRDVRGECDVCLALTDAAISHAKATGSVGATYSDDRGDGPHSVTVARALAAVARPSGLDSPDVTVTAEGLVR